MSRTSDPFMLDIAFPSLLIGQRGTKERYVLFLRHHLLMLVYQVYPEPV